MILAPSHGELEKARSWTVVPRLGSKLGKHLLLLVMVASAPLLSGQQTATAAGCHVAERPALSRALSWEPLPISGVPRDVLPGVHARPAFVPVPCPGEIPTLPTSTMVVFAAQLQSSPPGELLARGERIGIDGFLRQPPPFASGLLRPPRAAPASVPWDS
jgi:hypothetical protein